MSTLRSRRRACRACCFALSLACLTGPLLAADESPAVRIAQEPMVLPTYQLGPADPHPMFYMNESYQGAQKRIYPYALQDHLINSRIDQTYTALKLENEFVELSVLPELGGRLFSATDKTNDYDFFYRQHVIKPALIGMLGAWISGGVEWCAFHHHRNTTFMPVDYTTVENADGSKTIWFGETERRHRMKWLIGLTLYPDRSYIEATVKFFNRTDQPHSILYWANVAVHVNDDYQVIFPPSVQVATYHSKIDFTYWPIAKGRYRGYDYTGKDISWWKNSPVSNSFFAWGRDEDFMGGYDHSRQAGVVHVADRHIVSGAKLWEWGTGTDGRAWDKILTDEDGPYAELMVGAFSDNQPDYSWIKPHEVKTIKQYWFPVRDIGGFKHANLNGAVNLELRPNDLAMVGFHTTARFPGAKVVLTKGTDVLLQQVIDIGPDKPFTRQVTIPAGTQDTQLRAALIAADGKELIAYQPVRREAVTALPDPVKAPPKPEDITSLEELYLTGLRVEQIHNPRVDPLGYYREALRRDPGDSRSNIMMGINCNKRGLYAEAEAHLRRAVERLTQDYTRSRTGEAHFHLGVSLLAQHRDDEAYDQFYRASWDQAFHSAAFYELAAISCRRGEFAQALGHIEQTIATNALDTKAWNLQAAILRRLDRHSEASLSAARASEIDPLDFWARHEFYLNQTAQGDNELSAKTLETLTRLMRDEVQAYLELATDYMHAGLFSEALEVLRRPVAADTRPASVYPLVHYYLGYLQQQLGSATAAAECFARAAEMPSDYCFPFRLETADVLQAALAVHPDDARAEYYLGNLLFDLQPDVAIQHWERSRSLDKSLAVVHRNLGWAYYHVKNDLPKAIDCYEQALSCSQLEPRLLLELDILYENANVAPEKRLAALTANHAIVARREDSLLREIALLVINGQYPQAIEYLEGNFFHAQEGRDEIHDIYVNAHLLQGLRLLKQSQAAAALKHFEKASEYPENLSVGRPKNDPRAPQVAYYTGLACEALGDSARAKQLFTKSAEQQETEPWPETRFYQALSLARVGQGETANKVFDQLVENGRKRMQEKGSADFFAKFGQEQSRRSQMATAHYLIGLGLLGKENKEEARKEFEQAAELNLSQPWARYQLDAIRQ
jgi:tetratricopeptide (TPR) repeat protein